MIHIHLHHSGKGIGAFAVHFLPRPGDKITISFGNMLLDEQYNPGKYLPEALEAWRRWDGVRVVVDSVSHDLMAYPLREQPECAHMIRVHVRRVTEDDL